MAQKIYVGQTALKFIFDTGIDLTSASSVLIKYIKSDATEGSWTGVFEGEKVDGLVSYTIADSDDLDMSGNWKFWVYVTFSDGTVAPGDFVSIYVYSEGK